MSRRSQLGSLLAALLVVGTALSGQLSGQDRAGTNRMPSTANGDWPY